MDRQHLLVEQSNHQVHIVTKRKNNVTKPLETVFNNVHTLQAHKEKIRKIFNSVNVVYDSYISILSDTSFDNAKSNKELLKDIDKMWASGTPLEKLIGVVDGVAYTSQMRDSLLKLLKFMSDEAKDYVDYKEMNMPRNTRVKENGTVLGNIKHVRNNWGNLKQDAHTALKHKLGLRKEGILSVKGAARLGSLSLGGLGLAAGVFFKSEGLGVAGGLMMNAQRKKIQHDREQYEQHFKDAANYKKQLKEALAGLRRKSQVSSRLAGGGKFKAKKHSSILVGDNPGGVESVAVQKKNHAYKTKTQGPSLVNLNKGDSIRVRPMSGVGQSVVDPKSLVPEKPTAQFGAGTDAVGSTPIVTAIHAETTILRQILSDQKLFHQEQMAKMDDASNASKGYSKGNFASTVSSNPVAAAVKETKGFVDNVKDSVVTGLATALGMKALGSGAKVLKAGAVVGAGALGGYGGYKAGDWISDKMDLDQNGTARKVVDGTGAVAGGLGAAWLANKGLSKLGVPALGKLGNTSGATPVYVVNAGDIGDGGGALGNIADVVTGGGKSGVAKKAGGLFSRAGKLGSIGSKVMSSPVTQMAGRGLGVAAAGAGAYGAIQDYRQGNYASAGLNAVDSLAGAAIASGNPTAMALGGAWTVGSSIGKAVNWGMNKLGLGVSSEPDVSAGDKSWANNSGNVLPAINQAASQYGVSSDYLKTMAYIESNGNPNAQNKSGAKGLFQFMSGTAKGYGIAGKEFDPVAAAGAAARLTRDNAADLSKRGVPTSPWLLYMAHQQGAPGVAAIWKAAANGTDVPAAIRRNMDANGGRGKSPREFLQFWKEKFYGAAGSAGVAMAGRMEAIPGSTKANVALNKSAMPQGSIGSTSSGSATQSAAASGGLDLFGNKRINSFRESEQASAEAKYSGANLPAQIDAQADVQANSDAPTTRPVAQTMPRTVSPMKNAPVPVAPPKATTPIAMQQAHVDQHIAVTRDREKTQEKERMEKSVQTSLLQNMGAGTHMSINNTTNANGGNRSTVITTGDNSLLAMYNMFIGQLAS